MSDGKKVDVIIDGEVSPLRQKLREAAADLKRFGTDGEQAFSRMTSPLAAVQSKIVAVSALLAGGSVFKEAVRQAADFTEQSMKLGTALGISASEASTFITALEDIDVPQEAFIAATKGMSKELKNNEDVLQKMGLKTRDAAGHLRPLNDLVVEGIEIVKGYKAGTDRAIAGQTMFGKSFEMTGNLLKLNSQSLKENAELQKELGVIVGSENVAAWEEFDSAGDKTHLTLKAMYTTVGNSVMPVLTQLGEWFSSIGPAAVVVLKGVVGSLVSVFWGLKMSAEIVWNVIALGIEQATIQALRFVDVFVKTLRFDFSGAAAAWKAGGELLEEMTKKRLGNINKAAEETQEKLWNLFADGTPSAAPSQDGKSANNLLNGGGGDKDKKSGAGAAKSAMPYYEAQLVEKKNAYEQENAMRQFSKAQELEYWSAIKESSRLTAEDRVSVAKKVAALEIDIRRQAGTEGRALDAALLESRRNATLAQIELEEQQAEFALENGEISQLQKIGLEEQFSRRRFEIEYQSLLERLELAKNDPGTSPAALAQIKEQLLEVERKYLLKQNALNQQKKTEKGKGGFNLGEAFGDLGGRFSGLWNKGINAMMAGTLKWRNATKAIFAEIVGWFATSVVGAMVKRWAAGKAAEFAISMGWMTKEEAITQGFLDKKIVVEEAASVKSLSISGGESLAKIGNNAGSAAAGAAASVADIPYIGPILAAAAFAGTMAMVLGAKNNVKSASMGFDIPRGLNPLTQLHEEEMVLPSVHANTIRKIGEQFDSGGGKSSREGAVHMHVHTQSTRDFERFLTTNSHVVAPALRRLARNFTPSKS